MSFCAWDVLQSDLCIAFLNRNLKAEVFHGDPRRAPPMKSWSRKAYLFGSWGLCMNSSNFMIDGKLPPPISWSFTILQALNKTYFISVGPMRALWARNPQWDDRSRSHLLRRHLLPLKNDVECPLPAGLWEPVNSSSIVCRQSALCSRYTGPASSLSQSEGSWEKEQGPSAYLATTTARNRKCLDVAGDLGRSAGLGWSSTRPRCRRTGGRARWNLRWR
jgi:hypothetical protein